MGRGRAAEADLDLREEEDRASLTEDLRRGGAASALRVVAEGTGGGGIEELEPDSRDDGGDVRVRVGDSGRVEVDAIGGSEGDREAGGLGVEVPEVVSTSVQGVLEGVGGSRSRALAVSRGSGAEVPRDSSEGFEDGAIGISARLRGRWGREIVGKMEESVIILCSESPLIVDVVLHSLDNPLETNVGLV